MPAVHEDLGFVVFFREYQVFAAGPSKSRYAVLGTTRCLLVHTVQSTHWHHPLLLIFDSETMPEWFGMPDDADLPSTFSIEYVRAWKRSNAR